MLPPFTSPDSHSPCLNESSSAESGKGSSKKLWWVYVIQSQELRKGKRGQTLPGFHYVGSTTDPARRIRQHNGELVGGGRYTSMHRPWQPRALFGTYANQSEALKAERALKHGLRGPARVLWSPADSAWCRGLGPKHPWILDCTLSLKEFPN